MTWKLYDLNGRIIGSDSHNQVSRIEIAMGHLASGTYVLRLETAKEVAVVKVMKNQ